MSSVVEFLIERLENAGLKHVFGYPGTDILELLDKLQQSTKIELITTTDEASAGYAADAYARIAGFGCVVVPFNTGALKLVNGTACAFAERSPLMVISGEPSTKEQEAVSKLHRLTRPLIDQREIFDHITCTSTVLTDPTTAGYLIDQAFENMHYYMQPVYIGIPRDIANKPINYDVYLTKTPTPLKSDQFTLNEALEEVTNWISRARQPVIMAGVEIARYGLGEKLTKFAEKVGIPVVTTLLSKSVINEQHPLYAGLYTGQASAESTFRLVDTSDCLLMFGVMLNDMNPDYVPAQFVNREIMSCSAQGLRVKHHAYHQVTFVDFCEAVFKSAVERQVQAVNAGYTAPKSFECKPDQKITTDRLFEKINSMLDKHTAILADVGDALFGAGGLRIHHSNYFLSPAFYRARGFAIPGALGV